MKKILFLHLIFFSYSFIGILCKKAALISWFSYKFVILIFSILLLLILYAFVWQQVLKKIPLSTAFAHKSVTVFWNYLWGAFIFNEIITVNKLIGAAFVIVGIIIYSYSEEDSHL